MAKILHEAALQPLTRSRLETLARTYGYDESALAIVPRLLQGDWPFLRRENTSPPAYSCALKNPVFPQSLTKLQKSWLKALTADPRIRLFFTDEQLTELEDFLVMYRRHIHTILKAMGERRFLSVDYRSRKDRVLSRTWLPCRLEYGQRDGKFRLFAMQLTKTGRQRMDILNLPLHHLL